MANAEIVVTRKHGNVFIGGQPLKINLKYDAKHINTSTKIVLQVEKVTSEAGESFVVLDIYPKTHGTVKVTYGGITKTITDTIGAAEPAAQHVFFGDSDATPASGEMVIEGEVRGFGVSSYDDGYYGCITAVDRWDECEYMPNNAFRQCAKLQSIVIPEGITKISNRAFQECTELKSVIIPASVTAIGLFVFFNTLQLKDMTILAKTPPTLGSGNGLMNMQDMIITVPKGCGDAYRTALKWSDVASKIVEAAQ